jgi:putative sigma-54 modulation protein
MNNMTLTFTGRHLELTPGLKTHATDKMQHLESHFEKAMSADIILSVEKLRQIAEATLHVPHFPTFHASAETEDMYASIDAMVKKLATQIQRHKEKELSERDHK